MNEDPEPTPQGAETYSPAQWAKAMFPRTARGHWPRNYWQHRVAEVLHGWARHEHEEGKPMQLSAADYEAAIKAASKGKPHPPARSRHKPERKKKKPEPETPTEPAAPETEPPSEAEPLEPVPAQTDELETEQES